MIETLKGFGAFGTLTWECGYTRIVVQRGTDGFVTCFQTSESVDEDPGANLYGTGT
jgi:hypothetical protein